jgi:hypothetical protein
MEPLIRLQALRILSALAVLLSVAYVLEAGHRW